MVAVKGNAVFFTSWRGYYSLSFQSAAAASAYANGSGLARVSYKFFMEEC